MRSSWAGVVVGFAGLALLGGVVRSKRASSNVGGLLAKAGDAVRWFVSPAVPFFSEAAPKQSSATTSNHPNASTTSTASTQSAPALSFGATT